MCEGCPFREPGESRSALLRYIVAAPDETWPCHESDPDGLCLGDECAGRALFAKKIMAEVRNDGTNR
jgi:hypothetical protein